MMRINQHTFNGGFVATLIVLLVSGLVKVNIPVHAQTPTALGRAYAVVNNSHVQIYGADGTLISVNHPDARRVSNLTWNADGTLLSYVLYDEGFNSHLYIADAATGNTMALPNTPLEIAFPPTFTSDNALLYVGTPDYSQAQDVGQGVPAPLYKIALDPNAQPQQIGEIKYETGCGGGTNLPMMMRYWDEAGFGGNPLFFKLTEFGLIYTSSCSGSGLTVLNLETGESRELLKSPINSTPTDPQFGRFVLAPDGKRLAGVQSTYGDEIVRDVVVIDLASMQMQLLNVGPLVDQVAWSVDGNALYFSTNRYVRNILDALAPEEKQRYIDYFATGLDPSQVDVGFFQSELHRYDLASQQNTTLYVTDAYAIPRIVALPEGVLFSAISNGEAWVSAIGQGTYIPGQSPDPTVENALVPVVLYKLDNGSTMPVEIGQEFTLITVVGVR